MYNDVTEQNLKTSTHAIIIKVFALTKKKKKPSKTYKFKNLMTCHQISTTGWSLVTVN